MLAFILISPLCRNAAATDIKYSQVQEVTLANFDEVVKNSKEDVLIDFYSPKCGYWYNLINKIVLI